MFEGKTYKHISAVVKISGSAYPNVAQTTWQTVANGLLLYPIS